jgi:large subunit ribosomal protein L22
VNSRPRATSPATPPTRRASADEQAESSPSRRDNEALAVGTTIRGSAQKLNLVAGLIRGRKVEDAMNILAFSKRAMAVDARKVLASAIANAENNHNLDVDALVVAEASVGKSITMKRWHARGRGKSTRIIKPFSRLRIVVREASDEEEA